MPSFNYTKLAGTSEPIKQLSFLYVFLYALTVKTLNVTEFREQCLQLLDGLPSDGVLITKQGRPVAKLMPVVSSCVSFIGSIKNIAVDPDDDLFSTEIKWDAQS